MLFIIYHLSIIYFLHIPTYQLDGILTLASLDFITWTISSSQYLLDSALLWTETLRTLTPHLA